MKTSFVPMLGQTAKSVRSMTSESLQSSKSSPPQGVYVPEMVHELTTERVLTMEWLDGVRLRSAGDDPSKGTLLNLEDMKLVEVSFGCDSQLCIALAVQS